MEKNDLIREIGNAQDWFEACQDQLATARLQRDSLLLQASKADIPLSILAEVIGVTKQRVKQVIDAHELQTLRFMLPKD